MSNKNGIRKISIAPGGVIPGGYGQVTRNKKFYACASKWSILFYILPEFKHCETLCQGSSQIKMIRLSKSMPKVVAILYQNGVLQLYDFVEHSIYDQQILEQDADICWMEFNFKATNLLMFSKLLGKVLIYNVSKKELKSIFVISLPALKFFIVNPEMENVSILVGKNNSIIRLNYDDSTTAVSEPQNSVYCLKFDPLNSLNCLMVSKSPTWKVFTFLPNFNVIAECKRDDLICKSGDWVGLIPGHVITGDYKKGLIYIWCVATGECIDTISVYNCGMVSIVAINDKDFVLAFQDGSLGVFDVHRRQLTKTIICAHTNTVFSCQFLPTESSIFATTSSDGKIVFWNSPSLTVKDRFTPADRKRFLCISFSPGGGYTACGTIKGELFIYSVKEHRVVFCEKIHNGQIIGVSWCLHNNDLIATSGEDKACRFFSLKSLKVKTTITTKSQLKRAQWSNTTESIALACADGGLYVRMEGGAYQIIKGGSTSPLFEVDWHPNDDKRIAASDDDGNILVFYLDAAKAVLAPGHAGKARPVCWSRSIDYLLFSGGYDGFLVLWDTRNMSKIMNVQAHSTHIYGISSHKDHPMLVATASRDETVRLWSVDRLFPEEKINAVLSDEKFAIQKYCNYEGCSELLKLLHRVLHDGTRVTFFNNELCHANDVIRIAKKRVSKLTAALPKDQETLLRAKNAKRSLTEAADISLKTGDIKKACELLFLAGEYDKAISFAPAVSYKFWQNLVMMRGQMLRGTEGEPEHSVVADKPEIAIEQLLSLHEFNSAELVCASMKEKTFAPRTKTMRIEKDTTKCVEPPPFLQTDFNEADDFSLYQVSSQKSLMYARDGKPLFAAAALLTVGDVIGAAYRLIHCGEICWAMEIVKCIEDVDFQAPIREEFVIYCIVNGCYENAFDLLSNSAKRKYVNLIPFENETARNKFYLQHKLRSLDQYSSEVNRMKGANKVQCLILAGKQKEAETTAANLIRSLMSVNFYDYSEIKAILSIVQSSNEVSDEIAALSHFFGVYEAMWRGYGQIIPSLITAVEKLGISWINEKLTELKIAAALATAKDNNAKAQKYIDSLSGINSDAFEGIKQLEKITVDGGSTVKAHGSGIIPNDMGASVGYSFFTKKRIDGNVFYFEDDSTAVSEDEALMWYEVSPFSPLASHKRFNPY
ncbi:hypothetical protein TRFO_17637 [Tritrichomonas foetus]|uniref:Uncharacterized protein n=1 Tax=Tritrichomonas foetus TaxID=1144522 RepID=A0A1J4KRP2_9EUKA|nr:hypothetical protein TRFO_17637 [Tritrichomonas foetus]|eukprot:OHT12484.1 hypothetical protein TRFO_17637 [Tritrichomonas foetus]